MTMLTSMIVMLTAILILVSVPGIYGSWLQFKDSVAESDVNKLLRLQSQRNEFVIRHMCMALLALGFVVVMRCLPELERYSQTADATAVYSAISFTLALVESIFSQKIYGYTYNKSATGNKSFNVTSL